MFIAFPVKMMLRENAAKEIYEFTLTGLDDEDVRSARVKHGWNEFTSEDPPICCRLLNSVG